MRLDKWLKISRLIKRRTVAKAVAESGRILVNGHTAKPSTLVKPGDRLEIDTPTGRLCVEVLSTPANASVQEAAGLYRMLPAYPGDGEHTLR
jgi:ribosomal 50S subunit-recycling heat shock protein